MIACQILGQRVAYGGGRWRGSDEGLVEVLQILADARREAAVGSIPDPDRDIVDDALLRLGGRIVSLEEHERPEAVAGRIY